MPFAVVCFVADTFGGSDTEIDYGLWLVEGIKDCLTPKDISTMVIRRFTHIDCDLLHKEFCLGSTNAVHR